MSNKNNSAIHIACAVDEAFSYPLAVLLVSCFENNKDINIKIHLFSASLSKTSVKKFSEIVKRYNQEFVFYALKDEDLKGLPITNRISLAAYYRILIPENIDNSVDKYLYLDADMIVTGKLESLFRINLNDKILAAVNDVAAIDMEKHKKHNITDEFMYFNSGVLLVDKNNWLKTNAGARVLQYRKQNNDICDFLDQDGLNGALYKERVHLSPKWNQQVGLFYVDKKVSEKAYPESDIKEAKNNPAIVHFNGGEKPWNDVSAHPYKNQFKKYARMVKEFGYSEKADIKKLFKRHIIYRLFGWSRVNRFYYLKTKPMNHNGQT